MRVLKCFSFFVMLFLVTPAMAFTIVGFDGEPFYFKNGSEGIAGGCYVIMQKFCEKEKLHCKFKIAPLSVILDMLKSGKADAGCPLSVTESRRKDIYFSENYFRTRFAYFGVPETARKVAHLKDLASLSVGVFTPSRVSESLEKIREASPAEFEIIQEASNYSTLMRAEKISTVLAYVNQEIGDRWVEKTHSPLVKAPLAGEELAYNIGFSRKKFSEEKLARFKKTLETLKSDSEIQAAISGLKLQLWETIPSPPPSVITNPAQTP